MEDKLKDLFGMVRRLENFVETSSAGSVSDMITTREKVKDLRAAVEKLLSEK